MVYSIYREIYYLKSKYPKKGQNAQKNRTIIVRLVLD